MKLLVLTLLLAAGLSGCLQSSDYTTQGKIEFAGNFNGLGCHYRQVTLLIGGTFKQDEYDFYVSDASTFAFLQSHVGQNVTVSYHKHEPSWCYSREILEAHV